MQSQNDILVSVVCNAYNHGNYIRDALEGFVSQKTDFKFEVLVHDDASTDNTADIIREYEAKYPDIIKPIYQTENQYSKGIRPAKVYQYPRAKGKYIALCEGDDYWTDELKLQKQVEALSSHPEIDICTHSTKVIWADTGKLCRYISPANENTVISTEKVIYGEGDFVATNSILAKREMFTQPLRFRQAFTYDYTLQIQGSLNGGMLFLDDCMSVYRFMSVGSWSSKMAKSKDSRENFHQKKQQMLDILNEETNGKFNAVIERRKLKNELLHLEEQDEFDNLLSKKYRSVFKELPLKRRLKIRIKSYLPFMVEIIRKIKR